MAASRGLTGTIPSLTGTFAGTLDAILTAILMLCVLVILAASARAWMRAVRGEPVTFVAATAGPDHSHIPGSGCC